jgi:hypothetical protein
MPLSCQLGGLDEFDGGGAVVGDAGATGIDVVAFGQVGADRGVQGIAVEGGQEPGEGGMGRDAPTSGQVAADAELLQHRDGGAPSPLGDLGDGPGTGDDCAGADQQQADQGIPPPATRTLEVDTQTAAIVLEGQFRQDGRIREDEAAGTGPQCDQLA